jgi:hypothetical protein
LGIAAAATGVPAAATDATVAAFAEFRFTFNKTYATRDEEARRLETFGRNLETVHRLNDIERRAQPGLAGQFPVYGITNFMDLTPEEFSAYKGFRAAGRPAKDVVKRFRPRAASPSPKLLAGAGVSAGPNSTANGLTASGWCASGYCTPIKNQGACGDCWAFAAIETMETMSQIDGSSEVVLSPQQLADCDTQDGGCGGGNFESAWTYAENTAIESVNSYPITSSSSGKAGTCHSSSSSGVLKASSWKQLSSDEQDIATYIQESGPVAIGVDANNWQFYTGGQEVGSSNSDPGCNPISASSCGTNLDHAVSIVGYTLDSSGKYIENWQIRNHWSTSWGCQGFAFLTAGENTCGLTSEPATVKVKNAVEMQHATPITVEEPAA